MFISFYIKFLFVLLLVIIGQTLLTWRGMLTHPRKSSWLPDLALWAICLKNRPRPLTPRTSLSLLTASKTEDSSSWSLKSCLLAIKSKAAIFFLFLQIKWTYHISRWRMSVFVSSMSLFLGNSIHVKTMFFFSYFNDQFENLLMDSQMKLLVPSWTEGVWYDWSSANEFSRHCTTQRISVLSLATLISTFERQPETV